MRHKNVLIYIFIDPTCQQIIITGFCSMMRIDNAYVFSSAQLPSTQYDKGVSEPMNMNHRPLRFFSEVFSQQCHRRQIIQTHQRRMTQIYTAFFKLIIHNPGVTSIYTHSPRLRLKITAHIQDIAFFSSPRIRGYYMYQSAHQPLIQSLIGCRNYHIQIKRFNTQMHAYQFIHKLASIDHYAILYTLICHNHLRHATLQYTFIQEVYHHI